MRRFPGTRSPTTDFAAVRSDLQTTPLYVEVDLTSARSLAAGTALDLPINGNVIYIDQKSLSGYATLHFNDDAVKGNTGFTVFPGFVARVPYVKVVLENVAQPGMSMRIIYGTDIDFQPAVSAGVFGEVSVVDGAKARTVAGQAFMVWGSIAAAPVNYAHVQARNNDPARNLFVERIVVSSGVSTAFMVGLTATLLAGDLRAAENKRGGALADSNVRARAENLAAQITDQRLIYSRIVVNQPFIYQFTEPVMVPTGYSIFVVNDVVNADLIAAFEYFRETN